MAHRSAPAELVQARVADAEVVGDLMHHGDGDFLDYVLPGGADPQDGAAEDRDPVRQRPRVSPRRARSGGPPRRSHHDRPRRPHTTVRAQTDRRSRRRPRRNGLSHALNTPTMQGPHASRHRDRLAGDRSRRSRLSRGHPDRVVARRLARACSHPARSDRRAFYLIDLSSFGTTLNGRHVPRGYDRSTGAKRENGAETALPGAARIGLADMVFLDFRKVP